MTQHISPCTWCGARNAKRVIKLKDRITGEDGFWVGECRECNFLYTCVRPDGNNLSDYYSDDYCDNLSPPNSVQSRRPALTTAVLSSVYGYPIADAPAAIPSWFIRLLAAVTNRDASHIPFIRDGQLLDVGAGRGGSLSEYIGLGWQATGIEPSEYAVRQATEAGLDVRRGTLEEQHFPEGAFDAVVMNHVLEHVPDVKKTLLEVHRVLKSGGWLLVRAPNAASLERFLYGTDWYPWEVPRHLSHFTPSTLDRALTESGFNVVRFRSEFRPDNLAMNAAHAINRRFRLRINWRVYVGFLLPLELAAARMGRSGDLSALALRRD